MRSFEQAFEFESHLFGSENFLPNFHQTLFQCELSVNVLF